MKKLWLSKDALTRNVLVAGASGSMKTSLLLDWADQAIAAGTPCIFTDVKAGEDRKSYTSNYYRPGKDYIFNVADKRCVTWRIDREFRDPLTALAIARRLIPLKANSIPYFVENARYVLQHAFGDLKMSVRELLHAVHYPERADTGLFARMRGGKHGDLFSKDDDTRRGLVGNLKYATGSLELLPTDGEDFSAYDWAAQGAKRSGHIFLASSRNNWLAQQDLQALLLDCLFLNIQTFRGPGAMFLDEVGIFKSEEIEPALSVQRDSGVPIILAFQNFSQLEENYGIPRKWSILSNPETLVILRMRGRDADDAQNLVCAGSEIERYRESWSERAGIMSAGMQHTYAEERPMVKPVTAGMIQAFDPGQGVLVQGKKITRIQLAYHGAEAREPSFVPREWETYTPYPPDPKKPKGEPKVSRYTQTPLTLGTLS